MLHSKWASHWHDSPLKMLLYELSKVLKLNWILFDILPTSNEHTSVEKKMKFFTHESGTHLFRRKNVNSRSEASRGNSSERAKKFSFHFIVITIFFLFSLLFRLNVSSSTKPKRRSYSTNRGCFYNSKPNAGRFAIHLSLDSNLQLCATDFRADL